MISCYYIFVKNKDSSKNRKGKVMKIQRVLTYEWEKDEIKNFFESEWWDDVDKISDIEFEALEDDIRENNNYIEEKWIYPDKVKEEITEIWEQERQKAKPKKERVLEEIRYYKNELARIQNQIKALNESLKNAE